MLPMEMKSVIFFISQSMNLFNVYKVYIIFSYKV